MKRGITREALLEAVRATNGAVREEECPFPGSHLYTPTAKGSHPGLVLLHGSEGARAGFTAYSAIRLASQGYAALALGYFGTQGSRRRWRASTLHAPSSR
jgi:dienelactone hydrolase